MAFLHAEAIKKKSKKVKMPNKIFDANHTEKKPDFLNLGSKKTKLAPLTSYPSDFQKLANKLEIRRSNAGKISEKL